MPPHQYKAKEVQTLPTSKNGADRPPKQYGTNGQTQLHKQHSYAHEALHPSY